MGSKEQKYNSLRKECLKNGELFRDPQFPANNKSLFFSKIDKDIEWKRPKELCKVPKLISEGVSCDDLVEGELGNAWFVTACSSLVLEPKMWQKVIPDYKAQEFTTDETQYAGIFHFQFWRYGKWVDVVIDDQLPTKNNKLVFCHSKSKNEFWSALLEKAYAKLYGDYESLSEGHTADALVDFTGGVAERFVLTEINLQVEDMRQGLFEDVHFASENKALVTATIACQNQNEIGQDAGKGLIKGHGYAITAVKVVKIAKALKGVLGGDNIQLLRMSNPWGTKEWTGAWSDESPEWAAMSTSDREKMGIKFEREGEFWISWNDVIQHFTNVDVCHFVNTSIFSLKKTWNESLLHGEWTIGAKGSHKDKAGGCFANKNSFLYNPQYLFDIPSEDGDTFMVSLEQEDTHVDRQTGDGNNTIGFHVMRVEDNRKFRMHSLGQSIAESEYKNSRSIFAKIVAPRGRYVIIPTTQNPGVSGSFMLRMYTSSNANARALLKDHPKGGMCGSPCVMVTRMSILRCTDLEKSDKQKQKNESIDPYVIVKCEGESVKSVVSKDTLNPEWVQFNVLFYRKKPQAEPIIVEVMNRNVLVDEFLGMATIQDHGSESPTTKTFDLFGKKKKDLDVQRPGKVHVEFSTSDDLCYF